MPHAALLVVQGQMLVSRLKKHGSFNAARGFVGGASCVLNKFNYLTTVSMPHAALLVVQVRSSYFIIGLCLVSMPHAALLVVQVGLYELVGSPICFNAARGFVGGASSQSTSRTSYCQTFQCRTRLCWWCKTASTRFSRSDVKFQCRTRLCWWCKYSFYL